MKRKAILILIFSLLIISFHVYLLYCAKIEEKIPLIRHLRGSANDVKAVENYVYIAYKSGLCVVDVSNKSKPVLVGKCLTPGYAEGVYISGKYAYVADWDAGLRIIDISKPNKPEEVGYYNTPGYATRVSVSEKYAYVADWDGGLRIIDISKYNKKDK